MTSTTHPRWYRWSRRRPARALGPVAVGLVLAGAALGGSGASAGAQTSSGSEHIVKFATTVAIDAADAAVDVSETITYDFGFTSHHGIDRYIPVRFPFTPTKGSKLDDGVVRERVTPITDVNVSTDADTPGDLDESSDGSYQKLRIGDPKQTITGVHTYRISYRLTGVFNAFEDHDELYLNITGNGWVVPISEASATVTAPVAPIQVACYAGPERSALPCPSATTSGTAADFTAKDLGPNEGLTVVVALPAGTITSPAPILEEQRTLANAFRVNAATGGLAAGVLAAGLGLVGFLLWRTGRDRRYTGGAVDAAFGNASGDQERVPLLGKDGNTVEFVPPDNIRPGHLGTLWDEVANPLDVSAMIVDLAVRGYIRIEEIEAPSPGKLGFGRKEGDFRFVRLRPDTDGLLHAEAVLLEGLFRDGDQAVLSELKQHFAARLQLVESALYDDAVSAGWFPTRPDRVRARWHAIGLGVTIGGVVLTYFAVTKSHLGLVAMAVPVVGLVLLALGSRFPHRTGAGTALLGRVRGFKELFDAGEGERQRFAEHHNLFSEYLPYAIVFGCTEQWARTFADLGLTPEEMGVGTWYSSPYGYNPLTFMWAMNSFSTVTSGSIAAATPSSSAAGGSSGFGGGGFSGGGFGGGGGGSW